MRWMAVASGLLMVATAAAQGTPAGDAFPSGGIAEVLRARVGKPANVMLRSGKDVAGTVAEVRENTVVLTRLQGRDFYDAIVRLDDVVGVELRMRDR